MFLRKMSLLLKKNPARSPALSVTPSHAALAILCWLSLLFLQPHALLYGCCPLKSHQGLWKPNAVASTCKSLASLPCWEVSSLLSSMTSPTPAAAAITDFWKNILEPYLRALTQTPTAFVRVCSPPLRFTPFKTCPVCPPHLTVPFDFFFYNWRHHLKDISDNSLFLQKHILEKVPLLPQTPYFNPGIF